MSHLVCDRCKQIFEGEIACGDGFSSGCYEVAPPSDWSTIANPGEKIVCDACIWADPRYIKIYGRPMTASQARS